MRARNNSLDLYKILCMFLITTIHIIGYSGISPTNTFNAFLVDFLEVLQYFSISGFTLITGYFLVDKKSTKAKVFNFIFLVSFFSIIIYLISLLFKPQFSLSLIIRSFFPIIFAHYWYPINYLCLLILVPFLNQFARSLCKKQFLLFICVLAFITSTFFHLSPFVEPTPYIGHYSHSILWFVLLYFIAAYIKLHGIKRRIFFGPVMFLVCGTLIFVFRIIGGYKIFSYINLLSYNSVLSLLFTVSSFITFSNIHINLGRTLNNCLSYCMSSVFVIYLLQEHNAVRKLLWDFVNITKWSESIWLLPIILFVFIVLFILALILNLLYQLAHKLFINRIEKNALKIYDRITTKEF